MTPKQIAALTAAEMEHAGHRLTAADQREIERAIANDIGHRKRFWKMMNAPTCKWKKPRKLRGLVMFKKLKLMSYFSDAKYSRLFSIEISSYKKRLPSIKKDMLRQVAMRSSLRLNC